MHASGSAAQGQGLPGPSSAAGLVSANGVVDAASTSVVFIGRQTALPAAKHALQVLISVMVLRPCRLLYVGISGSVICTHFTAQCAVLFA